MAPWLVWLVVTAAFGIAEVLTLGLVLGMFALAAGAAAAAAGAGASVPVQILVFVVGAPLLLGLLRPARRRLTRVPHTRTGVEALVGRRALVLAPVDAHGGQVRIGGEVWSARAYDETQRLPAGATVDVLAIEGATALVHSVELP